VCKSRVTTTWHTRLRFHEFSSSGFFPARRCCGCNMGHWGGCGVEGEKVRLAVHFGFATKSSVRFCSLLYIHIGGPLDYSSPCQICVTPISHHLFATSPSEGLTLLDLQLLGYCYKTPIVQHTAFPFLKIRADGATATPNLLASLMNTRMCIDKPSQKDMGSDWKMISGRAIRD